MFTEIKAAAISFRPRKYDLEANSHRLEKAFRQAAKEGADLALGPEGILEGYVVSDILKGIQPAERMREVSLTVRSSGIERFRRLARELGICLAFGFIERIGEELFNCAIFIDHDGKISGKQHKMQFGCGYQDSWWFNRLGQHSRAFETPFGRAGFLICNDRWNPDIARILVLDEARYLLIPSFGNRSARQDATVLARARENGVPIIEANVGVTMIVSKGEIIKRSRKIVDIIYGTIEIPAALSETNRDCQEKAFLESRKEQMLPRYNRWIEKNLKPRELSR